MSDQKGNAPDNFAVLRNIEHNLLQREKSGMSIKKKQFRAACNVAFLDRCYMIEILRALALSVCLWIKSLKSSAGSGLAM